MHRLKIAHKMFMPLEHFVIQNVLHIYINLILMDDIP